MGHRTVDLDLEIYTFDIDFAQHVSNITYIRWLEMGRLQFLADAGPVSYTHLTLPTIYSV